MTIEQIKFLGYSLAFLISVFLIVGVVFAEVLSCVRSVMEIRWLKIVSKLPLNGPEAYRYLEEHRVGNGEKIGI